MSTDSDYFVRERYRGLDLLATLSGPLRDEVEAAVGDCREKGAFPRSTPADFSQELLFFADRRARDDFLSGKTRFPFYSLAGAAGFWRCQRSQAPYIEKVVEFFPHLTVRLVEQLWVERGRGMPHAFVTPNDLRRRWRDMEGLTPGLIPSDVSPGPYAAVFVMARCGVGGAEKTMRELAASIERFTGLPSLIVVADTEVDAEVLPPGAICLPNMTIRGSPFLRLPIATRAMVLRDLLAEVGAPRMISMNSFVGNTLLQSGALHRDKIRTASVLFCIGLGPGGSSDGYVRIADWLIDAGVVLFTDNDNIARILSRSFFYDNTVVLAMPAEVSTQPPPDGSRILWAGRLDAQKRPDILVDIASRGPHLGYEVWGEPLLSDRSAMDAILRQPNITYRGGFASFLEIDLSNIGALLFTSDYEGTPNLLLEAMARGVPCVCRAVGGVPDLMGEGRGVLVDPDAPAGAYLVELEALLADAGARRRLSAAGRDYIGRAHNLEVFDRSVARLLAAM